MRIPWPLIVAAVIGATATVYVTLHVIYPPFIPATPSDDIILNLSETRWVVVGPLYGNLIRVRSNVSMDVILGEASAVAAYLPAMYSDHLTYWGYRGRYHIINKSGIYAVVANEVCFAGRAVKLPNGIIVIWPEPISSENYSIYQSVCGVVDDVGLWDGRIEVIDGSPPVMVFYLHGGGVARGSELKEEFGRWEFSQRYIQDAVLVEFHLGGQRMYGRYFNGTMYYDDIDKVSWIAVKPRSVGAQIRISVRN